MSKNTRANVAIIGKKTINGGASCLVGLGFAIEDGFTNGIGSNGRPIAGSISRAVGRS